LDVVEVKELKMGANRAISRTKTAVAVSISRSVKPLLDAGHIRKFAVILVKAS
jgi:hypothetical protein